MVKVFGRILFVSAFVLASCRDAQFERTQIGAEQLTPSVQLTAATYLRLCEGVLDCHRHRLNFQLLSAQGNVLSDYEVSLTILSDHLRENRSPYILKTDGRGLASIDVDFLEPASLRGFSFLTGFEVTAKGLPMVRVCAEIRPSAVTDPLTPRACGNDGFKPVVLGRPLEFEILPVSISRLPPLQTETEAATDTRVRATFNVSLQPVRPMPSGLSFRYELVSQFGKLEGEAFVNSKGSMSIDFQAPYLPRDNETLLYFAYRFFTVADKAIADEGYFTMNLEPNLSNALVSFGSLKEPHTNTNIRAAQPQELALEGIQVIRSQEPHTYSLDSTGFLVQKTRWTISGKLSLRKNFLNGEQRWIDLDSTLLSVKLQAFSTDRKMQNELMARIDEKTTTFPKGEFVINFETRTTQFSNPRMKPSVLLSVLVDNIETLPVTHFLFQAKDESVIPQTPAEAKALEESLQRKKLAYEQKRVKASELLVSARSLESHPQWNSLEALLAKARPESSIEFWRDVYVSVASGIEKWDTSKLRNDHLPLLLHVQQYLTFDEIDADLVQEATSDYFEGPPREIKRLKTMVKGSSCLLLEIGKALGSPRQRYFYCDKSEKDYELIDEWLMLNWSSDRIFLLKRPFPLSWDRVSLIERDLFEHPELFRPGVITQTLWPRRD